MPAGTVTVVVTSVPETMTLQCTNTEAGIPGTEPETEEAYRTRVMRAGMLAVQGTPDTFKSRVFQVDGVQPRLVSYRQVNPTQWVAVVGGGDPYQVAQAIYESVPDISVLTTTVNNPSGFVPHAEVIAINDYPDWNQVGFLVPDSQSVSVILTWNTSSLNNQDAVTAPDSGCTLQSATGGGGYVRVKLPLSGISSLPVTVGAGGGSSSVGAFPEIYATAYAGESAWSNTTATLTEIKRFVASSRGGSAGSVSAHFEVLARIPGLRGGMSSFVTPDNGSCILGYGGYSALGGNPGHGSSSTSTMSNSASGYGYGLVAREVAAGGTALEAVSGGPGVVIIWEYA